MDIYNIIERDETSGLMVNVKEAFTDWNKAVITLAMYNRDSVANQYYYIKKTELDESEYYTTDRELNQVFVKDEHDNSIEVKFDVDSDGDAYDVNIEGTDIESLDLSSDLKRMISLSIEDAIEYIIESASCDV